MTRRAESRITLSDVDYKDLSRLIAAASQTMPEVASQLGYELERARVLPKGRSVGNTVHMGSEVEFRDDTIGRVQVVTLCFPDAADIDKGKISVLTPIGVALIGLPVGKSITWKTRNGDERRLIVLSVLEPGTTADAASPAPLGDAASPT
ncbi:MAG: nucleoside diphosphate kinase regulator [Microvirga sp.]|jgi:regulator of nucleoside diphosphate kinase|nr:nucleoside diphosphate kinase regulator [Microvirga sp.]